MIDYSKMVTAEDKLEQLKDSVRTTRDYLISKTDWTQLPDSPLLNDKEWLDYRQALRDITKQEGFPFDVAWPVKPY